MNVEIPGHLILNALAGSHAYGLNIPESDEDFRGVFVARKHLFYSSNFPLEVSDETNDNSFFELGKFCSLLLKANPSVLEFLNYPDENVRLRHPVMDRFNPSDYLTKECSNSFLGYAMAQIRKAYNFKKRINFPESEDIKSPLFFSTVLKDGEEIGFFEGGLKNKGLTASEISENEGLYALWKAGADEHIQFNESVHISNKSRGEKLIGYLRVDRKSYQSYKKEYDSYFKWKNDRSSRVIKSLEGGYDGKFMMHTFRLLYTAKDIALKGEFITRRPEKEFLLEVRNHQHEFSDLIRKSEDLIDDVRAAFKTSDLPEKASLEKIRDIEAEIRDELYS